MNNSLLHDLPGLIAQLGNDALLPQLDTALRRLASFDLSCVFGYAPEALPLFLHNGMQEVVNADTMTNYLRGTYLLDCVYSACKAGKSPGLYRLSSLAPDNFFEGEYYNSPDVHPCISMDSGSLAEEIVYLVPLPDKAYAAYSLMRKSGSPPFESHAFAVLQSAEPYVRALLAKQFASVSFAKRIETAFAPVPTEPDLEPVFASYRSTLLTAREQMITSLVLRGHSSQSIGDLLHIAEGTVKNHRKHIYAKLGISSQGELFADFVRHALKG